MWNKELLLSLLSCYDLLNLHGPTNRLFNVEIFVHKLKMTKEGRKKILVTNTQKRNISLDIVDLVIYLKYLKCKVFHCKTFRFILNKISGVAQKETAEMFEAQEINSKAYVLSPVGALQGHS